MKKLGDGKSSLGWVEGPREGGDVLGSMRHEITKESKLECRQWSEADACEIESRIADDHKLKGGAGELVSGGSPKN